MITESAAAEFEWFEALQAKLTTVFLADGYSRPKAEEAGFLFAQAIRDVPPLLRLLDDADRHTPDEIMDAVHDVLANRQALREAAVILLPRGVRAAQPDQPE